MKMYVGNLSRDISEDELKKEFAAFGAVDSAVLIKDKFSGTPKGFGFVEMSTAEEAQKAISMFNGQDLMGRTITVNVAKPREDKPRSFDRNRGGGRQDRY